MSKVVLDVKDADALGKIITDLQGGLSEVRDVDSGLPFVKSQLAEMKKVTDRFARLHRSSAGEGVEVDLPITKQEWQAGGFEMLLTAPTKMSRTESLTPQLRYSDPSGDVSGWMEELDKAVLLVCLTQKTIRPTYAQLRGSKYYMEKVFPRQERVLEHIKDAFDIADTGGGAEWIPTLFSGRMLEKFRLELRLLQFFFSFDMPSNPWVLPVQLADLQAYRIKGLAGVSGDPGASEKLFDGRLSKANSAITVTGKVQFDAKGVGARLIAERFLTEDSIVPILPFIAMALPQALANGAENAALNGDTTGTHMDNDIQVATNTAELPERLFRGMRRHAMSLTGTAPPKIDNSGARLDTDALWKAGIGKLVGRMGKWGVNRSDLLCIMSTSVGSGQVPYIEAFRTAYAVGSLASVFNASVGVAPIDGMNPVVSEFQREDLAATGFNTNAGPNTFTSVIVTNKRAWWLGNLRRMEIETLRELYAEQDAIEMLAKVRYAWNSPYGVSATDYHTGILYDIAP